MCSSWLNMLVSTTTSVLYELAPLHQTAEFYSQQVPSHIELHRVEAPIKVTASCMNQQGFWSGKLHKIIIPRCKLIPY